MLASRKPRRRRALLAPSALLLCAGVLGARLLLASSSSPARRLVEHPTGGESFSLVTLVLGDASCTTAYDGYLAVGVLFALVLYTFLGLAIVCDEYFCESLEQISSALSLSDDVAGATFMAAGSSAPELFTAIITIFVAPGEQGLGTIVGSAVFNLCVIVGVTALCAGQVLQLWWYPLVRDSTVYGISILMMAWAMYDGEVTVFESGCMVGAYVVYVALMMLNEKIVGCLADREKARMLARAASGAELQVHPFRAFIGLNPTLQPAFRSAMNPQRAMRRRNQREQVQQMLMTAITVNRVKNKWLKKLSSRRLVGAAAANEAEDDEGPSSALERCVEVVSWPLTMAMSLTIPDCRDEKWQRCFPLTFAMSILWIGILSFLMVDFAARAGCILGIPEFLMGLTVLAAGTSVPDALSSVLVARNGQGNMAVCNVLGSNVFNILLGLGLPWLIAASMAGEPYVAGGGDVMEPLLILFGYLVMFIVIVAAFGWRLTPGMGYLLLFLQLCYTGWNVGKHADCPWGKCIPDDVTARLSEIFQAGSAP